MSASLPSSTLPSGFRFGAVRAGIKPSGNADLAAIVVDQGAQPAVAAAMFTANRVVAAPLIVGQRHLQATAGAMRAVLINSGNANCATGPEGIATCEQVCAAAAAQFSCRPEEVFPSSTGIIGVPLPGEKIAAALPALESDLGASDQHFSRFAHAILTTDTRAKTAFASLRIRGTDVRIAAACKGAGMIHPQLVPHATMLAYVLTDAAIEPAVLNRLLRQAVETSFNRISIDGDTSTNDTVLLLASGASGTRVDREDAAFAQALAGVCTSLAKQIVADGEGATHVVTLEIEGAPNDADALRIAKAVAHSPLVKTAWAGNDPNWGRLLAAIGYSGVPIDPDLIHIWFGELLICARGSRAPGYNEQAAHALLCEREFTVRIALGLGEGRCRFWTTDLTAAYVSINADYST